MAIFEFIEGWYNPARRHSALGYQSPIAYERSQDDQLESASLDFSNSFGLLGRRLVDWRASW